MCYILVFPALSHWSSPTTLRGNCFRIKETKADNYLCKVSKPVIGRI